MAIQKKSVAFLSLLSAASSILGLVFSVVLASCYGVSRDVEIYFASSSLFFVIASLTQTGSITEIALPIYHNHVEKYGKEDAMKLYSQILNWMGLAATIVAIVSALMSKQIIHAFIPGFSPEDQDKAQFFFLCICPLFLVEIQKSILSTLLNAEKVFGRTELTNVCAQIGNIAFIYLFYKQLGPYAAMLGLWFGQILSFGYSLYLARKVGFRYHFIWYDPRFSVWELLSKIRNTFAYVIATQFYIVGLNAAISLLPAGQYAVYKYATLIFSKTQGLLLHPVTTVFFSQFSKEFSQGAKKIGHLIVQSNRITILSSVAVVLIVFSLGFPAFCWVWLNEKFDLVSIQLAYRVLLLHYGLLFFNGFALIYRKVNMAMGLVKELYLSFTAINILYAVILFFWPPYLENIYALCGISISNIVLMAFVPPIIVWLKQKEFLQFPDLLFFAKATGILLVGIVLIWICKWGLYSLPGLVHFGWFPVLCAGSLIGLFVSLLLFSAFRIEELQTVIKLVKNYAAKVL